MWHILDTILQYHISTFVYSATNHNMINSEGCLGGYNLHTFTYNHESTCQNMIASKRNIEKLVKPEKIVLTLFKYLACSGHPFLHTLVLQNGLTTLFLALVGWENTFLTPKNDFFKFV